MKILIVAGDPSGDLYGGLLLRALKARAKELHAQAVGGSQLRQAAQETGGEFLFDLCGLSLSGFVEPLRRLPTLISLRKDLAQRMLRERFDAVLCIDYYGFNRHVLSAAKAAGARTFYYVSPQIWASRPGRIRALKRLVDLMLVIFPFEEPLYRNSSVPVQWVGHPLLDILPRPLSEESRKGPLRLGILPGSRSGEIRRHLPVLLQAAEIMRKDLPEMEVLVFAAPQALDAAYVRALSAFALRTGRAARLVREADYAERSRLDFALTCSGTATLENALLGVPMVVIYRMSWATYAVARALIRVGNIAMANLLAGRTLVPELIQHAASPARVAQTALDMLSNPLRLESLRKDLRALRECLGGPGATQRAAAAVLEQTALAEGSHASPAL
ncbi:MAG: lipid-A-disaccharide synthase [Elusimicrobiota bacterium]